MVEVSKWFGFLLLVGLLLLVMWCLFLIELLLNCVIEDVLMVGVGLFDLSDYDVLEVM